MVRILYYKLTILRMKSELWYISICAADMHDSSNRLALYREVCYYLLVDFCLLNDKMSSHRLQNVPESAHSLPLFSRLLLLTPNPSYTPTVKRCLQAIRFILPKDTAMKVLVKWYNSYNAPGGPSMHLEWSLFVTCLMTMMGYNTERLTWTRNVSVLSLCQSLSLCWIDQAFNRIKTLYDLNFFF